MATSKETAAFILGELGSDGRFSVKPMFGEYAIYADGKTVGFICDNQLLLKIMPESADLDALCERAQAYPGSKDYFLVPEDLITGDHKLPKLMLRMAEALPMPKAKKKKKARS
ncbi:MAG: TfoX/Sxy family protein [Bacteroidetes bacterium]|nr:TfoX/Sxy family protein [Bacteroidota bacterium]